MQKTDVINREYITREEAASLLNITLPTLHRYAKMDRIRIYKLGSRSLENRGTHPRYQGEQDHQIRCHKPAFVLQRYFCTFVANPSDSISDVVIQMHFLSLYKGRICVYSTRTDFKRNSYTNSYTKFLFGSRQIFKNPEFFSQNRKSYTNSYTYSYTRFSALGKIYKIFKIGRSDSYRQDFKVAESIKFRIFNCRKLQNSYTYSYTKILSKHEKTATE